MRRSASILALLFGAACSSGGDGGAGGISAEPLSLEDELGFRRLRQDLHLARTIGDSDLTRSLWADDAVLTTRGGAVVVGADNIADFIKGDPNFGKHLVLTAESSWRVVMQGDIAAYGFETIAVDVGGGDPQNTALSIAGSQNPAVQIVEHTFSTGIAVRVEKGRWVFKELSSGSGPLQSNLRALAGSGGGRALAVDAPEELLASGDELGFRRMRSDFHYANLTGDYDLMRSVWADDGQFTTGAGTVFVGGDVITDFFAGTPGFGRILTLTPESSSRIVMNGDIAEYGFECISVDVGGGDPLSTELCSPDGTQNPDVEIVSHTNSTGFAVRVAEGRWVFQEFNGGSGPLQAPPG